MWYLLMKASVSGLIVMAVSEIAKRSPPLGGLIASLPLLSVLAMLWMWHETADSERIAAHSFSTFWYVLPTLPMFLLLPYLLRHGTGFHVAMLISCALTIALYVATVWVLSRFGIAL